jgi:NADH dehydrogenase/putative oxidoreductase
MQANSKEPDVCSLFSRLSGTSRAITRIWSSLFEGLGWPYIELAIRLWIAKLFFLFGILQLMHWQPTLDLAIQENPIPLLAPAAAVLFSTATYLVCGALLAIGLMTRYAALPLLALSFITQLRYEPFDSQLFWMALSGWFVIYGAGPVSFDNLLRRGLSDSSHHQ